MFLGLAILVCVAHCRNIRGENLPRHLRLALKGKRGLGDHSPAFPSYGSSPYPTAPIHQSLNSGYSLGGSSSGGFSLGHSGLHSFGGSSIGPSIGSHGIGYSLASPSSGLAPGYASPGLSHGSLNLQGISLGGHSAQSTYAVPNIAGSNGLFTPSSSSKTGPVTFGLHGGGGAASAANPSPASSFVSGGHGLSAYSGGSNIPVVLGSHGSSYGASLGSSNSPVTGGLVFASGAHGGSPSYNLPISGSSHGSSGSHGASATYTVPISSGSHGISALPSGSATGSYGDTKIALSSGSPDGGSTYEVPISSGSYSSPGSTGSNSYTNYLPSHSDGSSSYSSAGSSSYSGSGSSIAYAAPSSNYAGSSGSSYSGGSSSYSSPSVAYASAPTSTYIPTYSSSSGSRVQYSTPTESHGSYSNVSPRYLAYIKSHDNENSASTKYDTISYSSPNGKY